MTQIIYLNNRWRISSFFMYITLILLLKKGALFHHYGLNIPEHTKFSHTIGKLKSFIIYKVLSRYFCLRIFVSKLSQEYILKRKYGRDGSLCIKIKKHLINKYQHLRNIYCILAFKNLIIARCLNLTLTYILVPT